MKRLPIVAALFVALLSMAALAPHARAQDRTEVEDKVTAPNATVYVDGIACPFCAYGLEKKLKNLDAIQSMEVQLEEGRVLLAFKDGQSVTKDEIQKAVKNAGFTARKIEFAEESASEGSSS